MPQGISIHIGLNHLDPTHYRDQNGKPWSGDLIGCESDAQAMRDLATARGLHAGAPLLSQTATTQAVLDALDAASRQLDAGDLLLLTYSGHGGQVADRNGDEDDFLDETWALFDRELVDDELYARWGQFNAGVRIVVLSDSCHSGTVVKVAVREEERARRLLRHAMTQDTPPPRFRALPPEVVAGTYVANRGVYDAIQREYPAGNKVEIGATVLLLAGCKDDQLSEDGPINGLFTAALLHVWNDGRFSGDYHQFFAAIQHDMPTKQQPNFTLVGAPNAAFEQQEPFTV